MAMTLNAFTLSVDSRSLPRVLQIQSGIYFQGSVYEMYGRECCLPTGELMKIIEISITRFIADGSESIHVDLPLDYPGLFRIVADKSPYLSVQEIADSVCISSHRLGQPVFHASGDLRLAEGTAKEGDSFRITALKMEDGDAYVDCELIQKDPKHCFTLKLSQQGEFFECEDDQFYTLKELAEWKMPKGRRRTVTLAKSLPKRDDVFPDLLESHSGELTLTPVYELQAVMKFRKDVVLIPSNLDVEVIDVTEQCDGDCFVQPLSLRDTFRKPKELFPVVAEVIERPSHVQEELGFLARSKQVIVHSACEAKRILASEIRSNAQRHFLIPTTYNGRFKRRPREFPTAYNLKMAKSDTEKLHVVATRAFESDYDGLSSVLAGDQFLIKKSKASEVVHRGLDKAVDALACVKIEGKSFEPVLLPMCLDGGFVEVLHDKRQYTIAEICRCFPLPFNVKVSVRDLSAKEDPLAGTAGLHIEEEITDSYLLVSTLDLSECWEVPVNRTHMTLTLLQRWEGVGLRPSGRAAVEEIGEDCYYTLRRYATATVLPPPRPPKKPTQPPAQSMKLKPPRPEKPASNSSQSSPKSPHVNPFKSDCTELRTSIAGNITESPTGLLTLSNSELQKANNRANSLNDLSAENDDDMHDYEYIDEDELDSIRRKFNEQSIHKTVKGKPGNTI